MRIRTIALALALAVTACGKKDTSSGSKPAPVAPAKPGEPRRIGVEAGASGYVPATIEGKPGEKLVLVFTRTIDGECMAKVKFPDRAPVDLPKDQPVEIAVTVPTTGQMQFICGMDMNTGVVVPKS